MAALVSLLGLVAVQRTTYHKEYAQSSVLASSPISDARAYHQMAKSLSEKGTWRDGRAVHHTTGYPLILAGAYRLLGSHPLHMASIQSLLGVVVVLLTLAIGWRVGGALTGVIGGLLTALYGPLLFYETKLMPTVLGMAINMSLLFVVVRPRLWEEPRLFDGAIVGLLCGLSALIRPNMVALSLVIAGVAMWRWRQDRDKKAASSNVCDLSDGGKDEKRPGGPAWAIGALGVGCFAAVLSVGVARNYLASGTPSPFPATGGVTLYAGNNPEADGLYAPAGPLTGDKRRQPGEARQLAARLTQASDEKMSEMGPYEVSSALTAHTLGWLAAHPLTALKLVAMKLYRFSMSTEPRSSYSFEGEKEEMISLSMAPLPWGALWVFALIGLGWSWRTKKHRLELGLLAAYAAIHLLVGLLFFVSTRYRAPAAPALGVLAAFGIRASVVQLGRSKWAAILLVGGIVAVGVTKLDPLGGEASFRALSSFNRGVALLREGRAAEALDRFREASKAEPEDPLYRLHIGNALVAMGEEVEARESYLKAIEMKPSYSLAHINLGVLACRRHDYQACLRHLKQGARLAPYLPESHLRLAQALMLTGRSKEAKSHLIRARNLADEVAPDQARLAEKLLRRIRSRPKQSR